MPPLTYFRDISHFREYMRLTMARIYAPWLRLVLTASYFLVMVGLMLAGPTAYRSFDAGSFLAGLVLSVLLIRGTQYLVLRRVYRRQGPAMGERKLEFTEQGLLDSARGREFRVSWLSVKELTVAQTILVLWLDCELSIYISRSAFKSFDEEKAFVDYVTSRMGAVAA